MPQKVKEQIHALHLDKLGMNPLHAWRIGVESIESNLCLYGDINTPYVLHTRFLESSPYTHFRAANFTMLRCENLL